MDNPQGTRSGDSIVSPNKSGCFMEDPESDADLGWPVSLRWRNGK